MSYAEYKNPREATRFAKELRKRAPLAERMVWNALSELRKETGLRFRRQQPIHPYIVDFACSNARLIIELDGNSHDMRQAYDSKRTQYLSQQGWSIIRFTNEEVGINLENVIMTIMAKAKELQRDIRLKEPTPLMRRHQTSRKGRGTPPV